MIQRITAAWVAACFCLAAAAGEEAREEAPLDVTKAGQASEAPHLAVRADSIPVLKTVLQPSENWKLAGEAKAEGYYYHFHIVCPHGEYDAVSVRKLIKLCHELDVLEGFRKTDSENHVWTGVSRTAKGIGVGFGNIFIHPGMTAKTLGKSTAGLFRALGAPFRPKKEIKAADGTDRGWLGRGPAGSERRRVAYELGLDVYTDNPAAQTLIHEVAKKRFAGSLPLNIGVFALPGGAVFTMALTPMGHDLSTEELIRDNSPESMQRLLGVYLKNQFGLDWLEKGSSAQLFVDNPNYTPRERAYVGLYLNDLKELEGIAQALDFLARIDSPEKAGIIVAQLEMLSLLHQRGKPLKRFVPVRNTLGAESADNTLCLMISIDTVRFWPDVRTSLELSIKAARETGAKRIEIWSTGDVDGQSAALARQMGVIVHQNILEKPVFQRPRDGDPTSGRKRVEPEKPAAE